VHLPILALRELDGPDETAFEPVTLAGPTCDSADVIARDYRCRLSRSVMSWSAR
jgi:ornithine decarboxylase